MKEIMDMKPLNAEQMLTVRQLLTMSQEFSDKVKEIMTVSGIWGKGFTLKLHVCPTMEVLTEDIQMYRTVEDGDGLFEEEIERVRGCDEGEKWETNPVCTSREFIHLFDAVQSTEGTDAGEKRNSYIPPDPLLRDFIHGSHFMDSRNEIDSGNGYGYATNG